MTNTVASETFRTLRLMFSTAASALRDQNGRLWDVPHDSANVFYGGERPGAV